MKGMWNVPKYSNPEGVVYSAETVRRLAAMKPAAPDFMLMWDNAYCIHEFDGDFVEFPDIIGLCAKYGNGDMVYEFASTSKVTFPGAGVGVMASSEANIAYFTKLIGVQTIGYDKINQLRHVLLPEGSGAHAGADEAARRRSWRPSSTRCWTPLRSGHRPAWTSPTGRGRRAATSSRCDAMPGYAKRTLALCKEAGVTMTGAGATYPLRQGSRRTATSASRRPCRRWRSWSRPSRCCAPA